MKCLYSDNILPVHLYANGLGCQNNTKCVAYFV